MVRVWFGFGVLGWVVGIWDWDLGFGIWDLIREHHPVTSPFTIGIIQDHAGADCDGM